MSATIASMASTSSGPSVSSVTFTPLPAASIITPMMLLALILRPLRPSETSLWYLPASWVNLAAARACSPSLLMISTSRCCIDRVHFQVQHAVAASADRFLDHGFHAFLAVGERPHQHGQVHPGHAFDAAGIQQLCRKVARRGAVDVREDQHAVTGVEALDQLARLRQQIEWIVAGRDIEAFELWRSSAQDMRNRSGEAVAQRVVGDDEDPDHDDHPRAGRLSPLRGASAC